VTRAEANPRRRRAAFTLVETLVAVSVVALLVALLLPAVQAAREAARRAQCAANLKNVGLALHQHHESRGAFPAGIGRPLDASYIVQVLPFLERNDLYHAMNMDPALDSVVNAQNNTVFLTKVAVFGCPSEPARSDPLAAVATNYAADAGADSIRGEGVFIGKPLAARDVTDGLSQTAGVSEWVVGDGLYRRGDVSEGTRLGSVFSLTALPPGATAGRFAAACMSLSGPGVQTAPPGFKGNFWLMGGLAYTQYNHTLPPNRPSCFATPHAAFTAASFHGPGAHTLRMDGGVRFVKETVDPAVWAALGTRAGGEAVPSDAL